MQPAERLDKATVRALNAPAGDPVAHEKPDDDDHEHGLDSIELARIGLVAVAVAVSWSHWRPVTSFDVVAWGATIVGGYPIFKEAISALLARRMTMELSMTIAVDELAEPRRNERAGLAA